MSSKEMSYYVILNGNCYFDYQDGKNSDMTGITRQVFLFPCNTVPQITNLSMPDILKKNTLPIITWVLTCYLDDDFLLGRVPTSNRILAVFSGLFALTFLTKMSKRKGGQRNSKTPVQSGLASKRQKVIEGF